MSVQCKRHGLLSTLSIFFNAVCLSFAQAAPPPGWKTECIGYYQLSLPAEVDRVEIDKVELFDDQTEGTIGGSSGRFSSMAESPSPGAFEEVIRSAKEDQMKKKKELLAEGKPNTAARIQFYADLMPETFRIDDGWRTTLYLQRGKHIYHYSMDNPNPPTGYSPAGDLEKPITAKETEGLNKLVGLLLKNFQARALFEIPPGSGLCMPYGFIVDGDKNKGKKRRNIAVTFQLSNHPEIEIHFRDQTPSDRGEDATRNTRGELQRFWKDYYSAKKLEPEDKDGFENGFRAVNLAEREGLATFFKITRPFEMVRRQGDDVDYGYAAYLKGDYASLQDTPNLMLSVIRTAAHSGFDRVPMSKKELLKLAEHIAASVQRRVPTPNAVIPTAELRKATHPDYKTPAGVRQECLGRLLFDVPGEIEWGVDQAEGHFSRIGFPGYTIPSYIDTGQRIKISGVGITVRGPVPRTVIQQMLNFNKKEKQATILNMTDMKIKLEQERARIQDMQNQIKKANDIRDMGAYAKLQEDIGKYSTEIRSLGDRISAFAKETQPFDVGLPDSMGYRWGSALVGYDWRGYLWRDQYLYSFTSGDHEPLFTQHKTRFDQVIKHFRPRQRYEVPTQRGICFPHGFIQDEGTAGFSVENVMRFADQPDVIYSLLNHPFDAKTANDLKSSLNPKEPDTYYPESGDRRSLIGPQQVKIGALHAQQSGLFMLNAVHNEETYTLNTGYAGYLGYQVLSTIRVNMVSFARVVSPVTVSYEPTLKEEIPPLRDSLKRLDGLLKSIRLRPTEPPMPELVHAPQ